MKMLKRLILTLVGLVVVAIGLVLIAVTVIDPNQYKPMIQETVKEQTGLSLQLSDIQWKIFPTLGLNIHGVSLSDESLKDKNAGLLKTQSMSLSLAFIPLLTKQIAVKDIRLEQPEITYITFSDGKTNWDKLTQPSQGQTKPTTNTTEPASAQTPEFLQQLTIDKIRLEKANLEAIDQIKGTQTQIQDFSLTLRDIALDKAISLEFETTIAQAQTLNAKITGRGSVIANHNLHTFSIPEFKTEIKINQATGLNAPQTITLSITGAEADLKEQTANISNLNIQFAQLLLNTQVQITELIDNPSIQAEVNLNPLPLRSWLKSVLSLELPEMNGEKSLSQVFLSTNVRGSLTGPKAQLNFEPLSFTLDKSQLKGNLSYQLNSQAIKANLQLDQLNIADYQPKVDQAAKAPEPSTTDSTNAASEPLIPTELIKTLNADIALTAKTLSYEKTQIKDVMVKVEALNGLVNLKALNGNIFGGQVKTTGVLNVQGKEPVIHLSHTTQSLQMQEILSQFFDSDVAQGLASFNLNLNTRGNQLQQLLKGLTGTSHLELTQGLLKGVNLTQMAHHQLTQWSPLVSALVPADYQQKTPPAFQKDTAIKNLLANLSVREGQLIADTLSADLNDSSIQGTGKVDLEKLNGQVNFNLKLSESLTNPTLAKISWPIQCQGGLAQAPSCQLDSKSVRKTLEDLAKQKIKDDAKAKVATQLQEKLGLESKDQDAENALKEKLEVEKKRAQEKIDTKLKEKLGDFFR